MPVDTKESGFLAKGASKRVESAERALHILKSFMAAGEHVTLAELAQRTALHKSTILRLNTSLDYMGFIRRDPEGRFYLGPEVRRLGLLALAQTPRPLEDLVRPALQRLVTSTTQTASFYVLDGRQRICLFRENSLYSTRHLREEGSRQTADRGAAAQILKAFISESTKPRGAALRKAGWAISNGGREPNLITLAVPVRDARERVFGAIGVSGSTTLFTPSKIDRVRRALLREASVLRTALSR
ncbi:MAG TPA: helix-turn-helix domain-containing protein [Beijerinckiaceae bacterium]|jgi:DNA-binding IclR family transcriptional regulator|nr:helix-turn-helix domain-containing protein [Beijerinckiaceae bacterium]